MFRGFKKLILLLQSGGLYEPDIIVVKPLMTKFDSNGGTTTMEIKTDVEWKITIN